MKKYQLRALSLALLLLTSGNALGVSRWLKNVGLLGIGYLVGSHVQKVKQKCTAEFGSPDAALRNGQLMANVNARHKNFVSFWVALGANLNCKSNKYGTPLYAAKHGLYDQLQMYNLLQKLGAKKELAADGLNIGEDDEATDEAGAEMTSEK